MDSGTAEENRIIMDPATDWDRGADAWSEFVRSGADYYRLLVHGPALLEACLPVEELKVLDLGCGEGYFARCIAEAGGEVVGIDISTEQIKHASAKEADAPQGITYRVMDAGRIADTWTKEFDLVTACMSLHDMADVPAALENTAGVLKSIGRLVFSVPHPGTDTVVREWERDSAGRKRALKIDRYFDTGEGAMHWNMARLKYHWSTPHWRRTLEEWSALLAEAGFLIVRLLEPRPSPDQLHQYPYLDDCSRLPYFLIFDAALRR
jgi:2-polyprenyl-3-methyl-5-hydroxy-6-metoxy-1,4-benzoquinol methylase